MKLKIVILPKIPPTHAYTLHINGPYIQIPPAMAFTVELRPSGKNIDLEHFEH